jgi:2'-hydroxyisoflavone reductase
MRFLVFGGTQFVGRHIVDAALVEGHEVTLFNRGKTAPGLFGGDSVEEVHGDRDGGLEVLGGREWDAAIDVSGYFPRLVGDSARLLVDAVEHYTFVSSVSVYRDFSQAGLSEDSPLATLEDESVEEDTRETYGGLKVLCEDAVRRVYGDRCTIIRPGVVVGPHDTTDRFTYWVARSARGGVVLVPGRRDKPVQFIDARDLADFTLTVTSKRASGTFNAIGPEKQLSMARLLDECNRAGGGAARYEWVPEERLVEVGADLGDFPLYVREEYPGGVSVSNSRALAAGLSIRDLPETVTDTLAWARATGRTGDLDAGPSAEREAELLAALHRSRS